MHTFTLNACFISFYYKTKIIAVYRKLGQEIIKVILNCIIGPL